MLQSLMFFRLMQVALAGAFLVQAMIHGSLGVFGAENKVFSILRELYVVYICLTIFRYKLSDVHIQFELDNVTAVAYVN